MEDGVVHKVGPHPGWCGDRTLAIISILSVCQILWDNKPESNSDQRPNVKHHNQSTSGVPCSQDNGCQG